MVVLHADQLTRLVIVVAVAVAVAVAPQDLDLHADLDIRLGSVNMRALPADPRDDAELLFVYVDVQVVPQRLQ